jgi:hypothetical protein
MENATIWSDLLTTFRASPDVVKIIWSLMLPGVVLGVLGLFLRYRLRRQQFLTKGARLAYTIVRQEDDTLQIYSHSNEDQGENASIFLPLNNDDSGRALEYWQKPDSP